MNKRIDPLSEVNHQLITLVASYYIEAIENVAFYKEVESTSLQEMSIEHLQHWKKELRSLIFCGMNCNDERSA